MTSFDPIVVHRWSDEKSTRPKDVIIIINKNGDFVLLNEDVDLFDELCVGPGVIVEDQYRRKIERIHSNEQVQIYFPRSLFATVVNRFREDKHNVTLMHLHEDGIIIHHEVSEHDL